MMTGQSWTTCIYGFFIIYCRFLLVRLPVTETGAKYSLECMIAAPEGENSYGVETAHE